jgi:hypothetical protein
MKREYNLECCRTLLAHALKSEFIKLLWLINLIKRKWDGGHLAWAVGGALAGSWLAREHLDWSK